MTSHPELPLLHNGDHYLIDVRPDGNSVRLHGITLFPCYENAAPVSIKLFDLPPDTRAAVIRQINHRFPGKMVLT